MNTIGTLSDLEDLWLQSWEDSLKLWSSYVQLRNPIFCKTKEDITKYSIEDGIAHIRLNDHTIIISLPAIRKYGLEDYALEIMGHEIGHHVYCPGDLTDHGRVLARIQKSLSEAPGNERMVANLYTDLLINHGLFRDHSLRMHEVYQKINEGSANSLWTFYMRTYEILWLLEKGTLCNGKVKPEMEGDAILAARLVKNYAIDWVSGAGGFALLCLPYLLESDSNSSKSHTRWLDVGAQSMDSIPGSLVYQDEDESDAVHPAFDPRLNGDLESDVSASEGEDGQPAESTGKASAGSSIGQMRQPYALGEVLKAIGIKIDQDKLAREYYRRLALPYLISFPAKETPENQEPLMEGWEIWEPGQGIEKIDWMKTAMQSPVVIPGFTTMQPVFGTDSGNEVKRVPLDLDLYVDCSGSMPNPKRQFSPITLAGAICVLSALRAGAKVQATLWSGKNQFMSTDGFVRNEQDLLDVLTGYFGGGTQFPIHKLRTTYLETDEILNPVHILILSDEGVTTIFNDDEKGTPGEQIVRSSLEKANGGATMALNLAYYPEYKKMQGMQQAFDAGFRIFPVSSWDELIVFAKNFSKETYRP